jgi:hypothetical protein
MSVSLSGRSVHDNGRTVSDPSHASPQLRPERALCPGIAETSQKANQPDGCQRFLKIRIDAQPFGKSPSIP